MVTTPEHFSLSVIIYDSPEGKERPNPYVLGKCFCNILVTLIIAYPTSKQIYLVHKIQCTLKIRRDAGGWGSGHHSIFR